MADGAGAQPSALRLRVRGQVQGVGFRPHVYRLACELGLTGWVRNDAAGVEILVCGPAPVLETFLHRLRAEAPPLARIDALERLAATADGTAGFRILPSRAGRVATAVTPDTAVCRDCLVELCNPADRRHRYPFITCTHCGPRYSITVRLPYDRPNTSLARFTLCPACRAEYENPADRRFHAQPNACPACGPKLWLAAPDSPFPPDGDALAETLVLLRAGAIVALKGLGGFQLLCDARNAAAVARLRVRKAREEKPFAVLAANVASLTSLALADAAERAVLQSPERPIVLLAKGPQADAALAGVADGLGWLGAMLPATPLHYLLFHEAAGRPAGLDWLDAPQELLLVCTSANPGGEPLVTDNEEAFARLAGIADAFLLHDRDIVARCDDSVVRRWKKEGERRQDEGDAGSAPFSLQFIRRARGYTPRAIRLPFAGPPVLATGGFFKNTLCVTREDEAFLSPHVGDLDNAATAAALEEVAAHLLAVLEIEPVAVAHDAHPDFFSSRFAAAFAAERNIFALPVQHHHAHIAAVAAEQGVTGALLGIALDGVGLGADGTAWGGELLRVEGGHCTRLGHLAPLALPGGDRAAREPWRMAASALYALGRGNEIAHRLPHPGARTVASMLERSINAPMTSSCGRLFDAAAGLLGVAARQGFEGQAAMRLECLAQRHGPVTPLADGFTMTAESLSFLPLLGRLADGMEATAGAALFHATLVDGLAAWIGKTARREGIGLVALGGGCFLNAILSAGLSRRLREEGLVVLEAHEAPPNDGGLSLGQAWVAMNLLKGA